MRTGHLRGAAQPRPERAQRARHLLARPGGAQQPLRASEQRPTWQRRLRCQARRTQDEQLEAKVVGPKAAGRLGPRTAAVVPEAGAAAKAVQVLRRCPIERKPLRCCCCGLAAKWASPCARKKRGACAQARAESPLPAAAGAHRSQQPPSERNGATLPPRPPLGTPQPARQRRATPPHRRGRRRSPRTAAQRCCSPSLPLRQAPKRAGKRRRQGGAQHRMATIAAAGALTELRCCLLPAGAQAPGKKQQRAAAAEAALAARAATRRC